MTIAKLNKLLKAQIVASHEFQAQNPGTLGPDFDDVTAEILRSDTVAGTLLGSLTFMDPVSIISAVADVRKLTQAGDITGKVGTMVDSHKSLFGTALAMFYWGLKIGRKLEHDEGAILRNLETASEAPDLQGFYNAVVALAQDAKANGYAPIHPSELLDEARKIDATL